MTLNKKFSSNNMEPLAVDFGKGTQFMREGAKWTITEAATSDGVEMRRIVGSNGEEEMVTLLILIKDLASGDITFLPKVDEIGIALSKRENEQARIDKIAKENEEAENEKGIEIDLESDGSEHKFHKKF